MIGRRITVNLVLFVVLTAILAWWVGTVLFATTVGRATPRVVTAEFAASAGLQPLFEVTYLGHRVGQIGDIELVPGHVEVDLEIDPGTDLPGDLTAAVRNRSVVGEPYVELRPREGADGRERLEGGEVIALADTSLPPTYADSLTVLDRLLGAADPEDLGIIAAEMATAFEGTGPVLRSMADDIDQMTATFAEHADVLDRVVAELGNLTPLLASHASSLSSSVDDFAVIADMLRTGQDDMVSLLENAPRALSRSANVLATTADRFGCVASAAGSAGLQLAEEMLPGLVPVLGTLPRIVTVLEDVTVERGGELWLRATGTLNVSDPLEPDGVPRSLPTPPALPSC